MTTTFYEMPSAIKGLIGAYMGTEVAPFAQHLQEEGCEPAQTIITHSAQQLSKDIHITTPLLKKRVVYHDRSHQPLTLNDLAGAIEEIKAHRNILNHNDWANLANHGITKKTGFDSLSLEQVQRVARAMENRDAQNTIDFLTHHLDTIRDQGGPTEVLETLLEDPAKTPRAKVMELLSDRFKPLLERVSNFPYQLMKSAILPSKINRLFPRLDMVISRFHVCTKGQYWILKNRATCQTMPHWSPNGQWTSSEFSKPRANNELFHLAYYGHIDQCSKLITSLWNTGDLDLVAGLNFFTYEEKNIKAKATPRLVHCLLKLVKENKLPHAVLSQVMILTCSHCSHKVIDNVQAAIEEIRPLTPEENRALFAKICRCGNNLSIITFLDSLKEGDLEGTPESDPEQWMRKLERMREEFHFYNLPVNPRVVEAFQRYFAKISNEQTKAFFLTPLPKLFFRTLLEKKDPNFIAVMEGQYGTKVKRSESYEYYLNYGNFAKFTEYFLGKGICSRNAIPNEEGVRKQAILCLLLNDNSMSLEIFSSLDPQKLASLGKKGEVPLEKILTRGYILTPESLAVLLREVSTPALRRLKQTPSVEMAHCVDVELSQRDEASFVEPSDEEKWQQVKADSERMLSEGCENILSGSYRSGGSPEHIALLIKRISTPGLMRLQQNPNFCDKMLRCLDIELKHRHEAATVDSLDDEKQSTPRLGA